MKCPFCANTDTQVKDSRPSDDNKVIRRRRECNACHRRFTTFERFQVQQTVVLKRDGSRELFDRDKLLKSMMIALRKRPVSPNAVAALVADIEQELTENGQTEIHSSEIGTAALEKLKSVDFVGYVRYASVYDGFENPNDFQKLLRNAK